MPPLSPANVTGSEMSGSCPIGYRLPQNMPKFLTRNFAKGRHCLSLSESGPTPGQGATYLTNPCQPFWFPYFSLRSPGVLPPPSLFKTGCRNLFTPPAYLVMYSLCRTLQFFATAQKEPTHLSWQMLETITLLCQSNSNCTYYNLLKSDWHIQADNMVWNFIFPASSTAPFSTKAVPGPVPNLEPAHGQEKRSQRSLLGQKERTATCRTGR